MARPQPSILHAIDTTGPGGAETVFLDLVQYLTVDGYHNIAIIKGPGWVEDQLKQICGEKPYRHEGKQAAQWVLIDYINVVVHVMHPEARNFYKLEEMWSDAVSQMHES